MPTSKAISASKLLGKDRYEYYLNELVTEKTLGGHKLSSAQLKEAFKKRTNKISFEKFVDKVITTKTVRAATSPSTGPILGPGVGGLGPKGGALVKSPKGELATYKKIQVAEDKKEIGGIGDYIKDITNSLGNIIKILNQGISADIKNQQQKRRDKERAKREGVEKGLEKGFAAVAKVVDKVVAPVKSILSRIIDFFLKMFLARAVVKLIDWLADPKNQGKIKSLMRFFGDHWSKLFSLYIIFGTSFGKFARGLISLVLRSTVRLGAAVAALAVKVGIGKAGGKLSKVAGFLGGKKGKLLAAGLEAAVTVGGTMALSKTLEGGLGGGEQKAQGLAGGGYVRPRFPAFAGGGFNFKGMMSGAGMGAMFGPLGMLLGGALGGASSGFVSGEKGVDKVPAMLSDGEFVMSRGAVAKYGVDTLESMNAAGGGTNKPKIISGTTYAAGGGPIGYSAGNRSFDSERYDLTTGLRGETSKSDIYLVRAINELIKVLSKKFPDSGGSGGGGSSYPSGGSSGGGGGSSAGGGIGEAISNVYQRASSEVNKGVSAAKKAAEVASKKAEPLLKSLPARIDYGSLYLRSQLGGLGGSITESDLSKQTKDEYARAFEVAKAKSAGRRASIESQIRQYQGILKAPNLTPQQKAEAEKQLKVNQSRLAKYKSGQIDVQYEDFQDKDGKLSSAAKAAQKTLGAVWATSTKDGGIQIEKEPYDFPIIKNPLGLMLWPTLNKEQKETWLKENEGSPHAKQLRQNPDAWGPQKIAEAMYTLNPFATPVETDVKIGGTPRAKGILDKFTNMLDNPLLSMSRGLAMNLLKGKERDVVTGEAEKGSLFDKMFPTEKRKREEFAKNNPSAKLYDKPQKNTGEAYKSRFARPTNAGRTPVKPPTKPTTNVVRVSSGSQGGGRGAAAAARRNGRKPSTPSVSPAHPQGTRRNQAVLGIRSR